MGPNTAEGVFVEADFLHPELGFALDFPREWQTQNQPQFVVAIPPEGEGKTAIANGLDAGERLGQGQLLKLPISQRYTAQSR